MMWDTFPLPDRATAKIAERAAHRKLRRYQLLLRDSGEGWRSEWFNAPLPLIRRHVARIAARHNGTSFRLDMSERLLAMLDKWRSKQPDTPSRSVAVDRLVTAALDRDPLTSSRPHRAA